MSTQVAGDGGRRLGRRWGVGTLGRRGVGERFGLRGGCGMIARLPLAHHSLTTATEYTQEKTMIVRMLHYNIKPGKLDEYLSLFAGVKERVIGLEGINFFQMFRDLEDPNTLFLVTIFEDNFDMEKYNEVGPNQEYSNAVMPLIEGFDLAMVYEVSSATALPFATQAE
jgi:quinol monooxygenase YgiN